MTYYNDFNSPVAACFLDASKAFDRVNHWRLFQKLLDRDVPLSIVRILLYWYRHQDVCVRWGKSTSDSFRVTNGVRQGSLISPKLFSLYVDDLSERLNSSNIGCFINDVCTNHLYYADDLCILSPSPMGLQKLLNLCQDYGDENDISFNPSKSQYVVFKKRTCKLKFPDVLLKESPVSRVDCCKYLGVLFSQDLNDEAEMKKNSVVTCMLAVTLS